MGKFFAWMVSVEKDLLHSIFLPVLLILKMK